MVTIAACESKLPISITAPNPPPLFSAVQLYAPRFVQKLTAACTPPRRCGHDASIPAPSRRQSGPLRASGSTARQAATREMRARSSMFRSFRQSTSLLSLARGAPSRADTSRSGSAVWVTAATMRTSRLMFPLLPLRARTARARTTRRSPARPLPLETLFLQRIRQSRPSARRFTSGMVFKPIALCTRLPRRRRRTHPPARQTR